MSNPFGEPDDEENCEIMEGFLCPICREDLRTLERLTTHFEKSHSEDQDLLKSVFKDIFSKAKKKIGLEDGLSSNFQKQANIGGSGNNANNVPKTKTISNTRSEINVFNFMNHQEIGRENCHFEYFKSIRNPRLERYAGETNKLLIRLQKLLKNMPTDPVLRKQHEQSVST